MVINKKTGIKGKSSVKRSKGSVKRSKQKKINNNSNKFNYKKEDKKLSCLIIYLILGTFLFKKKFKKHLMELKKLNIVIPKHFTNKEVNYILNKIRLCIPKIEKKIHKIKKGGYLFKRIEDKADQPITGADFTRLLDELQGLTSNLRYVPEGRDFTKADVLLSLMRGDEASFDAYVKFFIYPNFYKLYPYPHFKNIFSKSEKDPPNEYAGGTPLFERYEDLGDYLLAYISYRDAKNQYLVDQGLKSPNILKKGFLDKFTAAYDKAATKYSMAKMQLNPKKMIIM